MFSVSDLLIFGVGSLVMVLSPGPNMVYLISISISQGKNAGIISLLGIICGFLFHILLVSFGLTAIFLAIPYAFLFVKFLGVGYLLYLAYSSLKTKSKVFGTNQLNKFDPPLKLFIVGLLTNILNPKIALFYLSFFPQFIKPDYGSILGQSFQLGFLQISISFAVNLLIVITAAKMVNWFSKKPMWLSLQKWFMTSVFTVLAVKLALTKSK